MVKTVKIIKQFISLKKCLFFLCISSKQYLFFLRTYKMVDIIKEVFENNDKEVIVNSINTLWLNKKKYRRKFTSNYKQMRQNIQKTQI